MYLGSGDILQFEELLHQDLVDLHQNHIHPVSVDQGQVSVTLSGDKQRCHGDVTVMSQVTNEAAVSHPLGLGRLCEDQREETQTDLLMLLLTFTHLQDR